MTELADEYRAELVRAGWTDPDAIAAAVAALEA